MSKVRLHLPVTRALRNGFSMTKWRTHLQWGKGNHWCRVAQRYP